MHQAGGLGRRKNVVRCSTVRQREMAALAADANWWVVAKTPHSRAVSSQDAVTMRLPSGLNAARQCGGFLLGVRPAGPSYGIARGLSISISAAQSASAAANAFAASFAVLP